jgi:multiple sugar transport system substrate-binding protein
MTRYWGQEFLDRKFAVMIEDSWLPVPFLQSKPEKNFEDRIGFIQALPVPYKNNQTSTLMGGYAFGIPQTSTHKDLAWNLIELALKPEILGPFLSQNGLLPTQISIATNDLLNVTITTYPYYRQLVSVIPFAGTRPSIPEYPQVADSVRQAIYEVQFENKDPNLALQGAAEKSARVLGW